MTDWEKLIALVNKDRENNPAVELANSLLDPEERNKFSRATVVTRIEGATKRKPKIVVNTAYKCIVISEGFEYREKFGIVTHRPVAFCKKLAEIQQKLKASVL